MSQTCPTGSIVSFPVGLNFNATYEAYNSLIEPQLNLAFNWGSGTDIPEFSSMGSGELYHSSFDSTRVTYNNKSYILVAVQITRALHTSWLALTNKDVITSNNQEDVIMTFIHEPIDGDITKDPQYIILVSPIVRTSLPFVSSAFLSAFANQTREAIGPETLFPNNPREQYAYYKSCAKGITAASQFQNVLVLIKVQGLLVWNSIMDSISSNFSTTRSTGGYGGYKGIFINLFNETPSRLVDTASAMSTTSFRRVVKVSKGYTTSTLRPPTVIQSSTDNYKCVPFNPQTDMSGGAIYVDPSDGTLLSNKISERDAAINTYNSSYTPTIPYDTLKKYTKNFMIITFSVVFVLIIIYVILSLTKPESEVGSAGSRLKMLISNVWNVPIYVVIAFICTFIGLFIGLTASAAPPPTPTPPSVIVSSGSPSGSPSR